MFYDIVDVASLVLLALPSTWKVYIYMFGVKSKKKKVIIIKVYQNCIRNDIKKLGTQVLLVVPSLITTPVSVPDTH